MVLRLRSRVQQVFEDDFAVASDFFRSWVYPKNPIAGPAPKVRQRCCPCSIADRVFFSPLTRPAVNPGVDTGLPHQSGVGTGLPHSILTWAQNCPTQSWRGHRIATLNSDVGTGLPRCFPENAGSAVLYSTTPPDSPPGLRGKHRQCVSTHGCTPGLAARLPGFKLSRRL